VARERDLAPGHPEIARVVAPNPGPMTLEGTNTYVVAAGEGAYVIDPGPAERDHVEAVRAKAAAAGGIAGILLTHGHLDHSAALALLAEAPLLWGQAGTGDETSADPGAGVAPRVGEARATAGPFDVLATPGHAVDHVCFLLGGVCFSGDLILGRGSSFVPPDGGSLAAYMESLRALEPLELELICPGHGPWVEDPAAKVREYLGHRLERERKLRAALAEGERSRDRLLDRAWDDVPKELRPAAALVMQAHLEKLAAEGELDEAELIG
jgi:glyoxylase-like metal-dependent hydrolase (beta-lactamase superfamily II)